MKAVLSVLELLAASAFGRASAGLIGLQAGQAWGMGARFAPVASPGPLGRRNPRRDAPLSSPGPASRRTCAAICSGSRTAVDCP